MTLPKGSKVKLVKTSDGSHTLYLPDLDEQYHSVHGAQTESMHVFIQNGYRFHNTPAPVVFEVGLGTGLNCLLTALEAEKMKRPTTFISIEKYPLEMELVKELNYGHEATPDIRELFIQIHESTWDETVQITPYLRLLKLKGDLLDSPFDINKQFDIVYFDAFGPSKQPEMWTDPIFKKIYDHTTDGGIFVTYSAKGLVRRQLSACGYEMERLPGPPGKFQMLRGTKRIIKL